MPMGYRQMCFLHVFFLFPELAPAREPNGLLGWAGAPPRITDTSACSSLERGPQACVSSILLVPLCICAAYEVLRGLVLF